MKKFKSLEEVIARWAHQILLVLNISEKHDFAPGSMTYKACDTIGQSPRSVRICASTTFGLSQTLDPAPLVTIEPFFGWMPLILNLFRFDGSPPF